MASSAWASTAPAAARALEARPLASGSARSRTLARRRRARSSVSSERALLRRPWLAAAAQAACSAEIPRSAARAAARAAGGRLANPSVRARDGTVPTSPSTLRATSTNTTPGWGSSSTLSSALAAASVMRSASSRMNTATRPSWCVREASSRTARTSSTSRLSPSGMIRCTSGWTPRSTRRQTSQVPAPPAGQLRAAAKARATWTLPMPGGPANSHAWVTRSLWSASRRTATASGWPTISSQTDTAAFHAREHARADLLGNLLGGCLGVDHQEAVGLLGGQGAERPCHRPVELQLLAFDAVALPGGPGEAGGGVEIQEDDELRQDPGGRPAVDALDRVAAEAAGDALVGEGGIQIAVAQDRGATVERRPDHLLDVLRAGGCEQQRLRPRVEVGRDRVEQDGPDPLADDGAARLPGGDHLVAAGFQLTAEQVELGGLAGALDALEGDEQAGAPLGPGARRAGWRPVHRRPPTRRRARPPPPGCRTWRRWRWWRPCQGRAGRRRTGTAATGAPATARSRSPGSGCSCRRSCLAWSAWRRPRPDRTWGRCRRTARPGS